jgi:hypothetical protein
MSRPPLPLAARLSEMLWIRCTKGQHQLFEAAARRAGLGISAWMRMTLIKAAKQGGERK